jgi:DDE family transposase
MPDAERGPPMTTVAQLSEHLRTIFTGVADALARSSGFVQRRSKLGGATFAQALVFGWLADPQAALAALAQAAAAAGVAVSPQGLDQRCTEAAAVFLEQLLGAALAPLVGGERALVPLLRRFAAVHLLDSTTLVLPDALGPWWPGCGGSSPVRTSAALKVHVGYDLLGGALGGLVLSDGRTPDCTTPLARGPLPPGALRVSDLGFFDLAQFARLAEQGAYWLSRLLPGTALFDEQGARLDLGRLLRGAALVQWAVRLGVQQRLPARMLAVRVPPEVAAQRRRRLRAQARKHGRTPSAEALALAEWTVLVTNAPSDLLAVEEALVLLRARWQVELLFRLWKSHARLDESRSAKPWRVLTEVLAKLLGVLVQHWVVLTGCWDIPERSLVQAAHTVRTHALHLLCALRADAQLRRALGIIHRCLRAGCRLNRRKRHPNTYQLLLDPALQRLG